MKKVQVFGSTATATAIMVEAVELVLKERVRLGEHEIEFGDASEKNAKVIHVKGEICSRSTKRSLEIGATVFVKKTPDGGYKGDVIGGFYLKSPGCKSIHYWIKWSSLKDELNVE